MHHCAKSLALVPFVSVIVLASLSACDPPWDPRPDPTETFMPKAEQPTLTGATDTPEAVPPMLAPTPSAVPSSKLVKIRIDATPGICFRFASRPHSEAPWPDVRNSLGFSDLPNTCGTSSGGVQPSFFSFNEGYYDLRAIYDGGANCPHTGYVIISDLRNVFITEGYIWVLHCQ